MKTLPTYFVLTKRQMEVASLVAHGYTNDVIALEMKLAPTTAKTHVSDILQALGFSSRVQLAIWTLKTGLVSLEDIELPEREGRSR